MRRAVVTAFESRLCGEKLTQLMPAQFRQPSRERRDPPPHSQRDKRTEKCSERRPAWRVSDEVCLSSGCTAVLFQEATVGDKIETKINRILRSSLTGEVER